MRDNKMSKENKIDYRGSEGEAVISLQLKTISFEAS